MSFQPASHVTGIRRLAWQTARIIFGLALVLGAVFVPTQKAAALPGTYWVNRRDDIAPRGTGVTCLTQASTDCTLREAVIKANANPGSTIRFDPTRTDGTPIILTRTGNDADASAGDLDINANTTIIGNGAANTIIQGAADASYTGSIGDKIFGVNQNGFFPSLTVSFSSLTVRYGDNAIPRSDPDFAYTGGGVDVWQTGTGNSATFTDCVISYNRNRYGWGGGFNFDQEIFASGSLTLTNVTFDHNQTTSTAGAWETREGGGLAIHGYQPNVTINNSTFTYNQTTDPGYAGGGIYIGPSYMGTIAIHGTTFDHNTATAGSGGGIAIYYWSSSVYYPVNITIDQNTQVTNNTAVNMGGGIYIGGSYQNNTAQLTNLLISGNSAREGGGIYAGLANANVQYSRIVNNTVTAGTGTGLYRNTSAGTITAERNWWGCSTGPGASPCDTAVVTGGTLDYDPWLEDRLTASPAILVTNQTSNLTASFLTDSSGGAVALGSLTQLINLPVIWNHSNAAVGSLSGTQGTLQPSGTATGAFTAIAPGSTTLYARVDNDNTAPVSSNVLGLTVNKANTTAAITSHLPDPSVIGQAVTFTVDFTAAYGFSPTAATGVLTVSDGTDSCTIPANSAFPASCNITFTTPGSKSVTASYPGDANFNASTSTAVTHVVSALPSVTSVSSTIANGAYTVGEVIPVTVTFSAPVTVNTTGGTPHLTLETGATDEGIYYTGGSGTNTLTFRYTVQVGDTSPDLDYIGTFALSANGGTIRDAGGNDAVLTLPAPGAAGSLGASKAIVIDAIAPDTAIDSQPTDPSNSANAVFTFSGTDNLTPPGSLTFECSLDSGAFVACTTPQTYTGLTEGNHTFQVQSVDGAGNVDPTPASYTWTVDTTPPNTIIDSHPGNPTSSTSAVFTFHGDDGGGTGIASFTCDLDGGGFAACTSPRTYSGLPDGSHTFQVRAVDHAGNLDPTPASYTWTIDTANPTVTMASTASDPTNISPIPVTVQFSETVIGFGVGDITPASGTVNNFTAVDGDTYTFDLTPAGQGLVTADIAAGVAQDASSNDNLAAPQFRRTYDSVAPNVTIDQAVGQVDPTNVSPVNFTVVFSEPVTGFATSDIILGGTAGATTGTVTGGPMTYSVAVSGMTTGGTVIATINAGVAQDAASNGNAASTSTDNTVTFTFDTSTTLVSSANPAVVGQTVTFTATVTSTGGTPTGNVEFREGAAVIGTSALNAGGQATFSTAALTLGTHNITAYYLGGGGYNASNSAPVAQVIGLASTTTALATSGSPSGFGATVTFTATVTVVAPGAGIPTGTVEFFDDGVSLGTGALDAAGQATLTTSSLTTGTHTITATYAGNGSFNGSTSPGITQVVDGPPSVTRINSSADTGDGQVLENEHTSVAVTQLLVVFSKDMNAMDAEDELNYRLALQGSSDIPVNLATYNNGTFTVTLGVNGGAALPNGRYTLTVEGDIRDTLGAPIGTNFVRIFYADNAAPTLTNVVTIQGGAVITNGATINVRFSSIDVRFNEDVYNPTAVPDHTQADDVTNPANYLLIAPGPNLAFDTLSCSAGLAGDDVQIPTGPVTYSNNGGAGPFVATVRLNNGTALPNGTYRLYTCGTTSVVDLAGNALNSGADDQRTFTVLFLHAATRRNPQTGFAPGVVTMLPEQPADKAYTDLGNLWIEIPSLNLKTSITGVPLKNDGWDVTWLNWQVGWLEGTAYPTWEGNTVLTAHGYTADGETGPFALLRNLSYGDVIIIHFNGMKYTYAIRTNLLVSPNDTRLLTKHEEQDWVTLITCQQYDDKIQAYRYRRVVRAVLVSVEQE